MNRRAVLASDNRGKLRELAALLEPLGLELLAQRALGIAPGAETATSFVENAIAKARHACVHSGLVALADDSGLAVDALGGIPGVRSARFAGPGASDAENVSLLLERLRGVAPGRRTARFVCVVVLLRAADDPCPIICEGRWEGSIAERPRGDGGFGYDPVFEVPGLGRTAAELAAAEKNAISHRARALHALVERVAAGRTAILGAGTQRD